MFKQLIKVGSDFSATFMSSAQSIFSGVLDSRFLDQLGSVTSFLRDLFEKPMIEIDIKDISLQTSTYGKVIPEVFGKMRMAGNLIWVSPIITTKTNYSSVPVLSKMVKIFGLPNSSVIVRGSFAVAICQGEIDTIVAIYADEIMLDLSQIEYQVYRGTENQEPNSTIQSHIGTENTPAFRGLTYIVFIDFPMELFNGRIPNLTFDVVRHSQLKGANAIAPQDYITGINLIPGSGEFVYDTVTQYRYQVAYIGGVLSRKSPNEVINQNTLYNKTDFLVSMDDLKRDLPNVKWIAPVVSWFTNSLDIEYTRIYPAFEFVENRTEPSEWQVGPWDMMNAAEIVHDDEEKPIYGGTVSDFAVLRMVEQLRNEGYKICFYPMIFLNLIEKPWRGHMTGEAKDVYKFFNQQVGYNAFILHYANLLKDKVDAFVIGSEFIGLTKIFDENHNFPAVKEFVKLATMVKKIMGSKTKITYAADWSEYHHTDDGWYNLDELWASPDIDMIGIDAYFPLSNSPNTIYDIETIQQGWESGEGYDFYYEDEDKTIPIPLEPEYAWKNIRYFWENTHYQPNGEETAWQPKMKKIWFTEYGFPSVDCTTNSPNVFYSDSSVDGGFPHLSRGRIDFKAQRCAIYATELYWHQSDMIEQKFLWTWDARPYPYFPGLYEVWADYKAWPYGHFLNGKIGYTTLEDIVVYLCEKVGLDKDMVDASSLSDDVDGYLITSKFSVIQHIALLSEIFAFDGYMDQGKLVFRRLQDGILHDIEMDEVIIEGNETLFIQNENTNKADFPSMVEIVFINRDDHYHIGTFSISATRAKDPNVKTYKVGMAVNMETARNIASGIIRTHYLHKYFYELVLPIKYIYTLLPLDLIRTVYDGSEVIIRIRSITIRDEFSIVILGNSDVIDNYSVVNETAYQVPRFSLRHNTIAPSELVVIDGHTFLNDGYMQSGYYNSDAFIQCALYSEYKNWQGCKIYISHNMGLEYYEINVPTEQSCTGACIKTLDNNINSFVSDSKSTVEIILQSGNSERLFSVDEDEFYAYRNLALVGEEIIAFRDAEILGENWIRLKMFLRGRFGTETRVKSHIVGEKFVLLNHENLIQIPVLKYEINQSEVWIKVQSFGELFDDIPVYKIPLRFANTVDMMPVNITQEKVNQDIKINWIARSNQETTFFDDVSNNTTPQYSVIIQDRSGNPKRKIFIDNKNGFIYSAQMQLEDFGTLVEKLWFHDN